MIQPHVAAALLPINADNYFQFVAVKILFLLWSAAVTPVFIFLMYLLFWCYVGMCMLSLVIGKSLLWLCVGFFPYFFFSQGSFIDWSVVVMAENKRGMGWDIYEV